MAQRSTRRIDDIVTDGFGTPLARARSHLFPSSSRVESWLGFGPVKVWVGRPHTLARFLVCTLRGSSCVCVADLFLSCGCVYPASLVCTPSFLCPSVYTAEFFVSAHQFPPRRGGSAGPSLRVAGLCLRLASCACVLRAALASTRVPRRLTCVRIFAVESTRAMEVHAGVCAYYCAARKPF